MQLFIIFACLVSLAFGYSNILRPFLPVILPLNTVANQTFPEPNFGIQVDAIDAVQTFKFVLTLPNGKIDTMVGGQGSISIPCGITRGSTAIQTNLFSFDNSQVGNYTLSSTVTYRVYAYSNCTGTNTNYTNSFLNTFYIGPANPEAPSAAETTTTMAFPATYTVAAWNYTTTQGEAQLNANAPPTSGTRRLSAVGITGLGLLFGIVFIM